MNTYYNRNFRDLSELILVAHRVNNDRAAMLIKKLKDIKEKNNYKFDIEVDGGINFSNSKEVLNAGANILVSGTTIFKENNGNIKKNIETLKIV